MTSDRPVASPRRVDASGSYPLSEDSDTTSGAGSEPDSSSEHDSIRSWYGIGGEPGSPSHRIESPLEGYKWPVFMPYRINKTEWAETVDYWPRRLLHIPTMTSHERGDGRVYSGVKKPPYSVLSYTWGRFQTPSRQSGCSITIHNVPWEIPSIQETHFTVEAFHSVLNQIRLGTDWVWVDIACIDQEDIEVKMDEIGRQAAIFREASFAYVWLSRISLQSCFEAMILVEEVQLEANMGLEENDRRLQKLEGAFELILSDPWFTSLWTLQEIMMRNDAILLSSEGSLAPYYEHYIELNDKGEFNFPRAETSNHPMTFNKLASMWQQQRNALLATAQNIDSIEVDSVSTGKEIISPIGLSARMKELADVLGTSGLVQLNSNNPHIQYGVTKYRRTIHAEDRIYAITQIYGLTVGQSLRPDEQPSLDELRTEFGLAVNALSLVQGQMFVHTASPYQDRSWCITEDSHVPMELRTCRDVKECSSVTSEANGSVIFTGQTCPFKTLLDLHNGDIHPWAHDMALRLQIYMDNDIFRLLEPKANPCERWDWLIPSQSSVNTELIWDEFGFPNKLHEVGHTIAEHYGFDNLLVLKLGDTECYGGSYSGGYKQRGIDHLTEQVGRGVIRLPRKNIALLLRKLSDGIAEPGRTSYARIGVCTWETTPPIDDFRKDAPGGYNWENLESLIVDSYDDDAWLYSESMRAMFKVQTSIKVM